MNDSILTSVKKLLGIAEDYTEFDEDLIIHINSVFSNLWQLGIGPKSPYAISDASNTWDEFLPADNNALNPVKSYMYMKCQMVFDTPQSSIVAEAKNKAISELEWRLKTTSEFDDKTKEYYT